MVEETKIVDTNTKTQLSLAAALFFSPLVQNMLNKNTRDITDQDKDFIRGYIKFGYITLLFGVITIVTGSMNYFFALKILNITYTISVFMLIFLLVISIVSILSDISLIKGNNHISPQYTLYGEKKDIIRKYLPIYNIYLWYTSHNFDKPNRRIKESILVWILFLLVSMMGNISLSTIVLILIIFRVAALMSDIDFFTLQTKQLLNTLFLKNPEEIVGYATGLIRYLIKSFLHMFVSLSPYTLSSEITTEKESYSHIIDIHSTSIIREYILGIFLVIGFIFIIKFDFSIRSYYVGLGLLLLRYLIMAIQFKHLPHLPIAREIFLLMDKITVWFKIHIHH